MWVVDPLDGQYFSIIAQSPFEPGGLAGMLGALRQRAAASRAGDPTSGASWRPADCILAELERIPLGIWVHIVDSVVLKH